VVALFWRIVLLKTQARSMLLVYILHKMCLFQRVC
jgi:hypothetical protein